MGPIAQGSPPTIWYETALTRSAADPGRTAVVGAQLVSGQDTAGQFYLRTDLAAGILLPTWAS